MKLYATVTSERASKGQGGEYLDIDIFTTNKEKPTHRILVREANGQIKLSFQGYHFEGWRELIADIVFIETKGEKQKGEVIRCKCPASRGCSDTLCTDDIPF